MSFSTIPKTEHWAIIGTSSTYHAADQRSIDAPGHGYPAHTTEEITYQAFETKEALELELKWRNQPSGIRVMHVQPLTVTTSVSVDVK